MDHNPNRPESIEFKASDGYQLAGHCWRHCDPSAPVVIINPATSVHSRYYGRFAAYLHAHGFNVLTYDYRGIGLSRHGPLKQLQAGWLDWGELDFDAALEYAQANFQASPIHCVGHSIGGVLIGMAPRASGLSRIVVAGAQYAYWPDYLASKRLGMRLRWHVVMPALTTLLGYFPGKRLGWLEDTPAGVVRDWTACCADLIDTYASNRGSRVLTPQACEELRARFEQVSAAMLVVTSADDPFATPAATERMIRLFGQCRPSRLTLEPQSIGLKALGHFNYFHSQVQQTVWPTIGQWLAGQTPDPPPSKIS